MIPDVIASIQAIKKKKKTLNGKCVTKCRKHFFLFSVSLKDNLLIKVK